MKRFALRLAVAKLGRICLVALWSSILLVDPFRATHAAVEPHSCFGDEINHLQAAKISRNSLFIAVVQSDGTLVSAASGFAVVGPRGSRIVTAAHVVEVNNNARLVVLFSDGMPLGTPRIVAKTSQQTTSIAGEDVPTGDLAVLNVEEFGSATARERFLALDGLPVRNGGELMVGETDGPSGAIWGYSGAPAVDRNGEVIGVLTGADFRGRVTLRLGSVLEANATGDSESQEATLSLHSMVVVVPLRSQELLQELGVSAASHEVIESTSAVFSGFPTGNCASTTARLVPANSKDGSRILKKWQTIDEADAWDLPPQFAMTKLKQQPW